MFCCNWPCWRHAKYRCCCMYVCVMVYAESKKVLIPFRWSFAGRRRKEIGVVVEEEIPSPPNAVVAVDVGYCCCCRRCCWKGKPIPPSVGGSFCCCLERKLLLLMKIKLYLLQVAIVATNVSGWCCCRCSSMWGKSWKCRVCVVKEREESNAHGNLFSTTSHKQCKLNVLENDNNARVVPQWKRVEQKMWHNCIGSMCEMRGVRLRPNQ